jgi:hypothetical protein
MESQNLSELLVVVRRAIAKHGQRAVEKAIYGAHCGRPDGEIVTPANRHLFRQYRNTVASNHHHLIAAAKAGFSTAMIRAHGITEVK